MADPHDGHLCLDSRPAWFTVAGPAHVAASMDFEPGGQPSFFRRWTLAFCIDRNHSVRHRRNLCQYWTRLVVHVARKVTPLADANERSDIVFPRASMAYPSETSTRNPGINTGGFAAAPDKPKRSMTRTQKILFFATGWLIVLMPFLFWWNTWFGRHLPDAQLTEYLHDDKKPRHIQQALVQISDRMSNLQSKHDSSVKQWYPDLLRLANYPVEEVRNTDAWVMGQDTSGTGFHDALLKMLADSSPMVRGNAALSLVRFGDATGRPQIVALLQPAQITSPTDGKVVDSDRPGTAIHQGGLVTKLQDDAGHTVEIRSPIPGRIRSVSQTGAKVAAGSELAVIDPATDQVWEALRALYLVGEPDDLAAIRPYERDLPDISNDVRLQAVDTEKAINARIKP
jgi:hypothetical protein